jgi:hypothetical protein
LRTAGCLLLALGLTGAGTANPTLVGIGAARSDARASTSMRARASAVIAFVNVNAVPMDREHVLTRRTIVITGQTITALGSVDSVVVPPDALRIDGENRLYVLPGLADMHVHLHADADLAILVSFGITTVRNMSGTPRDLDARNQIAAGAMVGPTIVTAGPIFYGSRGTGATPVEARALVDSQVAAGYDFIKVYDRLPRASYEAVVDEAAKRHVPVAGHVPGAYGTGLLEALALHQASIEHAEQFIYHYFGDDLDPARIPAIAARVKKSGAAVTPTLSVITSLIAQWENPDSVLHGEATAYLDADTYAPG